MPATKTLLLTVSSIERECRNPPPYGDSRYLRDTKLPGFGVRIQPSGQGTFYLFLPGGQKQKLGQRPFYQKPEAFELQWVRRRAAERLRETYDDRGPSRERKGRDGEQKENMKPFTIEAMVDQFTREHLEQQSASHRSDVVGRFRDYVLPKWRKRDAREITRKDVHDLVHGIGARVVANRVLRQLNTMFNWAITAGLLEQNLAHRVREPAKERPRDRVLSDQELALVWHACDAIHPQPVLFGRTERGPGPWGLWFRALMLMPGRRTELASMRWADIDLTEATWTLRTNKSKRPFVVPLCRPALDLLSALPQECDWVFTTTRAGPIRGYSYAKKLIDRWLAGRVEEIGEWNIHDLRRSCATFLGKLEVQPHVIDALLNHAPLGITRQVYNLWHYLPEKRRALEQWAEYLATIAEKHKLIPTESELEMEARRQAILANYKGKRKSQEEVAENLRSSLRSLAR